MVFACEGRPKDPTAQTYNLYAVSLGYATKYTIHPIQTLS